MIDIASESYNISVTRSETSVMCHTVSGVTNNSQQ